MVKELDVNTFKKEIADTKTPILVDFYATWCSPCMMLAPVLEDISKEKEFEGKLRFGKVNTEDYPEFAEQYSVQGIPCLIFIKNGKEVSRIVGFAPKPVMKAKIASALAGLK